MSLRYHAPSGCLLLPADAPAKTATNLRQAMRRIREVAGLPLDRYEVPGAMSPADLAQQSLVTIARDFGIDLGAEWCNEIDLRDLAR